MTSILMVCLGNICRSPLAEGILRAKLPEDRFYIDSAGTANYHVGAKPDIRSIEVAKKHNLSISNLKGRQFTVSDFDTFDFIYVMDRSNLENVLKLARNDKDKNKTALILNEIAPNENLEVPDPYYGGDDGFEMVYKMLNESCNTIAKILTLNILRI